MSYTLFTSEFTDISNEDWEIKIVSQGTAADWGKVFKVGPDGFRLNYDFDEYDRCKPVIGSRVQLTMYQDDTETASFEAFYDLLSSVEEGLLRIEIYKDQDVTNTLFWVGEILPEQTIIPDEFPNAAITITAVDGLANLKGIKYNNSGVNLVTNGDFSEIGNNLVDNPNFTDTGSELVTNGDFATDTDWNEETGWQISGGTANKTGSVASNFYQYSVFTSGKSYKLTFDVSNSNNGRLLVYMGGNSVTEDITNASNVTYTFYGVADGSAILFRNVNFTGSIDNVSVKELGADWTDSGTPLKAATFDTNGLTITSVNGDGNFNRVSQANVTDDAKSYKVTYTIHSVTLTGTNVFQYYNGSTYVTFSEQGVGTHTFYFTRQSTDDNWYFRLETSNGSTTDFVTISSITVQEVGQDWTLGTGATISGGLANLDGSAGAFVSVLYQDIPLISGKTYRITFNISNFLSGSLRIRFDQSYTAIGNMTADGFYEFTKVAASNDDRINFVTNAINTIGSITNISVEEQGLAPYTGTTTVLGHLHNLIQKLHVSDIWRSTDVELRFFEDFIGKEYKDSIGTAQNKQLENAKISQPAFYNKDEDGNPQFFSSYEVLESLALTFNACVFMSEGSIWWVPLGAIQSHASAGLSIANYMLGNGTATYNTVANTTIGAIFGSNSAQWEKLVGWERTTAPAFKEVKRIRDYQGNKPVVKDSLYTESDIVASTILDDEDILYPVGTQFLVAGYLTYFYEGDGVSTDDSRVSRLIIGVKLRVGDSGGADRYLTRAVAFNSTNESYATFYNSIVDTDPDTPSFYEPILDPATWGASTDTFDIVTYVFDKRLGTNAPHNGNSGDSIQVPFQFITPPLAAESTGLQLSASLSGANVFGANDSDLVNTTDADFTIGDFELFIYDDNNSQEFNTYDITASNPDTARYKLNQGTTLIGDRITDSDLGTISINNGSNYVDSTEWTSLQSSTASLSINGLGVRERLASNEDAKRIERGTLFKRGSTWIHPYTILTNTEHSSNFYQVSSLIFIAARSEYDIECMYLSRNITGITVANDNSKGTPGGGLPDVLPETKGPGPDNIVSDNTTKLGFITTDTYGITKVTTSTGGAAIDINLPISKSSSGVELISINTSGAMAPLADGATGEFLKTNGSGVLSWAAASGGGGWFGSTTIIKVMPSQFIVNDDIVLPVTVEDDVTNELGIKSPDIRSELYAFIAIPTGYKATHVKVSASASTASAVEALQYNHRTGATSSKGTGDFNSPIDISDITSSSSANIVIKILPASSATVIYGGEITIAAV